MDIADTSNRLIGRQIATKYFVNASASINSDLASNKKKPRCAQPWSYGRVYYKRCMITDLSTFSATEKSTFWQIAAHIIVTLLKFLRENTF